MGWRLDLGAEEVAPAPVLDEQQRRVVEHRQGPLLVLAGPGTGKTTTIVEAIRARLDDDARSDDARSDDAGTDDAGTDDAGTDDAGTGSQASATTLAQATARASADGILALTFGRRAAVDLRDRLSARMGGGVMPTVATFHSFAYALLRETATTQEYLEPPRLMSGAEEDVRIRELLRGAVDDGAVDWPEDLLGALPTLGLANEVRAVLARARELGLDGSDLERIGRSAERPAWRAVGQLAAQEQQVMALENVLDYGELLVRAVLRARDPQVQRILRRRFRAVFVDEYQDTDPLQVSLLRALVTPDTCVVAVGDPDQSIYAFRGADVGGLLSFPDVFRTSTGDPAPVVVLRQARRFGPRIRAAAGAALGSRVPAGLPPERLLEHRSPVCAEVADPEADDLVQIRTYSDVAAQAAHVARDVRGAHVRRGVPWRELAVIVRSAAQIPALTRALQAAGVPAIVAMDEIPLKDEPAVAVLLDLLDLAAHPSAATPARVVDLLTGPVGRLDPSDVRRLGRALRTAARRSGFAAPSSDRLILDFVLAPLVSRDLPAGGLPADDPVSITVARLRGMLTQAGQQITAGAGPQDVLWTLWTGGRHPHGWPDRLREAALRGSRGADHDLDSVMALFDAASRLTGRYPGFLGVRTFVEMIADQQIPAEPIADRGSGSDAVRVLTAHRSKGLEWDEVWVVGVQEGTWPDLRARGSTLRVEELGRDGIGAGPRPADLLDEERRLLYVACTRARHRLHLSAVDAPDDSGDRPSRLLLDIRDQLGAVPAPVMSGRPVHPSTLEGLIGELRQVLVDPDAAPVMRQAAAVRLAHLAAARDDAGRPLAPLADPRAWWGLRETTVRPGPKRDPADPLSISGSMLDAVLACPLAWYLEREVHAETLRGSATSFGSIVHAVADFVAKGQVPAELEAMDREVDRVWSELDFEARWQSAAERAAARQALERFLRYHLRAERELVDTETRLEAELTVPTPSGGQATISLSGFVDRIERDDQGRLVAIDLKNMRHAVPDKDVPENGQLGVYQLLLEGGTFAGEPHADEPHADEPHADEPHADEPHADEPPRPVGGAALVQLRVDAPRDAGNPKVQFQQGLESTPGEPTWVERRLGAAAEVLHAEEVVATRGPACDYCAYARVCPSQPEGEQVTS